MKITINKEIIQRLNGGKKRYCVYCDVEIVNGEDCITLRGKSNNTLGSFHLMCFEQWKMFSSKSESVK